MSLLSISNDDALSDDPFILGGSVGHAGENDRADVIKAQVLFGNTGHYDLAALGAPTGWPGASLEQAMRRFQKERGLQVDGLMLPQGETLQTLRDELGDSLKGYRVPGPQDVDRMRRRCVAWRRNGLRPSPWIRRPWSDQRPNQPRLLCLHTRRRFLHARKMKGRRMTLTGR